jgi:hypothetical protein
METNAASDAAVAGTRRRLLELLYIQNKRRAASRDARTKAALGGVSSIDRFDFRFFRPPNLCEYIYATTKKNKTAALVFSSSARRTNE